MAGRSAVTAMRIVMPKEATLRRQRVINYLADMLTSPACPLDVADLSHFRLVGIRRESMSAGSRNRYRERQLPLENSFSLKLVLRIPPSL
jgi:hypothetical protein